MKEKTLEKKLRQKISEMGGKCLKINSQSVTGLPDRLVLLPGGRMFFVELKTSGKHLSPRQVIVSEQLQRLGFAFFVVDDNESLDLFLREAAKQPV